MTELLPVLTLVGGLLFGLITGFPMAFTLSSSAIVTAFFFFGSQTLPFIATNVFGMMSSMVLIAMPLFILMACLLEKSGVAEDLYAFMYQALGPVRGGLSMGTVLICAIIAAMSGVSTTAVVTMGIIALPIMLKQGYHKSIAIGPILAGGALGLLIPPSISLIVYGMVARVSIGKLFAGGVVPGCLLVFSFLAYIAIRSFLQPEYAPALPKEERVSFKELIVLAKGLILPIGVVGAVLGTIFAGVASPTEAAAVGVAGALISALINRRLNWAMLSEAAVRSMGITGMIMWILFGAACFTSIFFRTGGQDLISELLFGFKNPALIFGFILVVLIVLGFFLDEITQVMITVPVFLPIIVELGYDPVWFGVLFMTQVQMDYLTPPFGFTLFYMKGVAPPEVSMGDIYRSILPFVLIQLAVVIFILLYPEIVMWLPNLLF
ncbi:TRAP transporter, DctM subunit [Desulfocicer vacuolatum DSM 3385]|uniref:TRAP transporter, DctM subunit n=1 Tax=Desulfocicer vacuolatum DSM 3385 TaxID=1121400 RepID=A0A1W2BI84_9BACT|nr:TRAP transporter large permease subunit [Desulfocicer vacuolatum]SMC72128.1 TRAP transporter, DctM subunit [Desulfocicer vacuolatum DSM 3385]